MPAITLEPQWLRAAVTAPLAGVDKEAKVIRGYVVAQEGLFKSDGRGQFDQEAIKMIAAQMNAKPAGLKSRLSHPGLSSDGIGSFLGRAKDARVELGTRPDREGKPARVAFVRADLHLDPSSFDSPKGNIGGYVLNLAESDPEAFGSSLVLTVDRFVPDKKGNLVKLSEDDEPQDVTPLWRPTRLHASDVVDEGDAVHGGFLSAAQIDLDALPDHVVRQAWVLLEKQFGDAPKAVIEARCRAFLARFLAVKFPEQPAAPTPRLDAAKDRLADLEHAMRKLARR